jgi:hypothetical protein
MLSEVGKSEAQMARMLEEAFAMVVPDHNNWSKPIDAVVPEAFLAIVIKAILFYTGGPVTIERAVIDMYHPPSLYEGAENGYRVKTDGFMDGGP